MHILPTKFVKIRHYGFLASRAKVKLKVHQMKAGILPNKSAKLSYAEITKSQLGFDVKFPIIDFTYLDGHVLVVDTDSNQHKIESKLEPIKNFLKNFEEPKIYLQTQLSPVKPEKKELPKKLLFVPLTTALKPKSERQDLSFG